MKHIIRSFKYRNYRLFFMGQSTSLVGTWMERLAISWLAYKLPSLRELAKPVYIEKGIIEQVEKGVQSASQLSVPPEN